MSPRVHHPDAPEWNGSPNVRQLLGLLKVSLTSEQQVAVDALGPAKVADLIARAIPDVVESDSVERELGPFYDTSGLRSRLGVTRQALDERVKMNRLLGLPTKQGARLYPVWQFAKDLTIKPQIPPILSILAGGGADAIASAMWLIRARPSLDGRSSLDLIDSGDSADAETIEAMARGDAARWTGP